jgi:predicted enzyme related to lactoylglutathione lyase
MAHRTQYTPGTFSWTDLTTTDTAAAKAFYTGLFGWETVDVPVGEDSSYTMASIDGKHVGAISPQPQQQAEAGVPPTWNSYVTVESADAATARAAELGATVYAPAFDVMTAGRMAAIQDPQGAHILFWEPRDNHGAGLVNAPGALTWNELASPDMDASAAFYRDLLGWQTEPMEGSEMPYLIVKNADGQSNGGIRPVMPPGTPPHWLVYFGTDDIEASLAKVGELGGTALSDIIDIGVGRIAPVQDPQGAVFALYTGNFGD